MDTLAVVNCGAVNVRVQVFVPVTLFSGFGCKPGLESRGHVATLANFLRTCQTVPRSHQREASRFSASLPGLFLVRHGGCDMASRRAGLHSRNDQ